VAAVASTAGVGDFTVAGFMGAASTAADLVDSTLVGSTGIDFTMADSTTADFTTTGFSSVEGSLIPGGAIIRTMGITITANPTPRRLGITVPILQAITLM
jgi:hypothetical protein